MAAAVYHCDKYSDVIVTPYSDIYFSNFTGVITQPCYYPASTENSTATVLCTNVDYETKYYCPIDYSCVVDASAFSAPYIYLAVFRLKQVAAIEILCITSIHYLILETQVNHSPLVILLLLFLYLFLAEVFYWHALL